MKKFIDKINLIKNPFFFTNICVASFSNVFEINFTSEKIKINYRAQLTKRKINEITYSSRNQTTNEEEKKKKRGQKIFQEFETWTQ
jgi:hypothetical protein